jgi:hypothetical protein
MEGTIIYDALSIVKYWCEKRRCDLRVDLLLDRTFPISNCGQMLYLYQQMFVCEVALDVRGLLLILLERKEQGPTLKQHAWRNRVIEAKK